MKESRGPAQSIQCLTQIQKKTGLSNSEGTMTTTEHKAGHP